MLAMRDLIQILTFLLPSQNADARSPLKQALFNFPQQFDVL